MTALRSAIAIVQPPCGELPVAHERTLRSSLNVLLTVGSAGELETHVAALRGAPCMLFTDATRGVDYELLRRLRTGSPNCSMVALVDAPGVDVVVDALRFGFVDVLEATAEPVRWRLAVDRAIKAMSTPPSAAPGQALREALLEPERRIILAALEANDWNRGETARQLQIDRTTLYKKMKQLRIAA